MTIKKQEKKQQEYKLPGYDEIMEGFDKLIKSGEEIVKKYTEIKSMTPNNYQSQEEHDHYECGEETVVGEGSLSPTSIDKLKTILLEVRSGKCGAGKALSLIHTHYISKESLREIRKLHWQEIEDKYGTDNPIYSLIDKLLGGKDE